MRTRSLLAAIAVLIFSWNIAYGDSIVLSNLAGGNYRAGAISGTLIAEAFTTGSALTINSVKIKYYFGSPLLQILSALDNGQVGAPIDGAWTRQSGGVASYTFSGSAALAAHTTYWLAITDLPSSNWFTTYDNWDLVANFGASIPSTYYTYSSSEGYNSEGYPFLFEVDGVQSKVPEPESVLLLGLALLGVIVCYGFWGAKN